VESVNRTWNKTLGEIINRGEHEEVQNPKTWALKDLNIQRENMTGHCPRNGSSENCNLPNAMVIGEVWISVGQMVVS